MTETLLDRMSAGFGNDILLAGGINKKLVDPDKVKASFAELGFDPLKGFFNFENPEKDICNTVELDIFDSLVYADSLSPIHPDFLEKYVDKLSNKLAIFLTEGGVAEDTRFKYSFINPRP